MGFKDNFARWVLAYISTGSFAALVNGEPLGLFGSLRGIRQGDPLSSLIFVIVMECLTLLLDYAEAEGKIKGLGKRGAVSHLFIVDDVHSFAKQQLIV